MNQYKQLLNLLPSTRTDVGTVIAVSSDGVVLLLQDGGTLRVKGSASLGSRVYTKQGVVTGPAPALTGVDIEI